MLIWSSTFEADCNVMFDLHTLLGRRLKSKSVTYETKSVCVE